MFTAPGETVVQAGDRSVAVDGDDEHMQQRGIDADLIDHHSQIAQEHSVVPLQGDQKRLKNENQ